MRDFRGQRRGIRATLAEREGRPTFVVPAAHNLLVAGEEATSVTGCSGFSSPSGLGCAISAVIAVLFGRSRLADEEPARGAAGRRARLAVSLPAASIWPTGRQRILLVDDDPGLRLLLRTTLAADEYAIEEAGSAEEAAELARFWQPALVVLDVNLPGSSGLAFCKELKERSTFGSPHVVLLTGGETSGEEASRRRSRRAAAQAVQPARPDGRNRQRATERSLRPDERRGRLRPTARSTRAT